MTCKQVGKSLLISEDPFIETSLHGVLFQAFPLLYLSLPGQFQCWERQVPGQQLTRGTAEGERKAQSLQ